MGAASLAALGVGVLQSGFNAWLGDEMQNRYMANWGGPEAQMAHMRAAGVNPFTAAGNLTGAAGDTNVGSTIGGYDLNNSIAALANSQMNPTVEDNTKSGTTKNVADAKVSEAVAEGQEIQNEINSDTKENQKQEIRDRARKMGYDADIADVTAEYAEDIQKATLDNLDADYNLKVKQHDLAQKNIERIDKEIDQIDENIKVLKEQVKYYKSIEQLNAANEALVKAEKDKVEKEREKLEIENEILEFDASKDLTGQYYRIRKKHGKAFADQWIKDAKQNIKEQKEAEVEGATTGQKKAALENDPVVKTQQDTEAYWDQVIADYDEDIKWMKRTLNDPNSKISYAERKAIEADLVMTEALKRRAVRKRAQQVKGSGSTGVHVGPVGVTD